MKNNTSVNRNSRGLSVAGLLGIVAVVGLVFGALFCVRVRTVEGNQMAVVEDWSGVRKEPIGPGTHFFIFNPSSGNASTFAYDMGVQVYVMNDNNNKEEMAEGRKSDAYVVQSADQQDMRISLRIQWRRLPNKVVDLHKAARDNVEERVLRPVLLNVVKNNATLRTALDAYSGAGLVKLQGDILAGLQASEELKQYVHVESFVIEHIGLDSKYTGEIVARQVAVQERLKNIEQTKAAEAAADKAKALAQSDYEKTLVEARRDKEKGILEAEKTAQQAVLDAEAKAKQVVLQAKASAEQVSLQAEAERNRNVLIAQGEKEAAINRAQAIEALGKAEAEAKKLGLSAYAVPGADAFVKIEVAKSLASAFQNVKGYLPSNVNYSTVGKDFNGAVNALVGGTIEQK
jgi:regulator of protease activity HflC (stomatin/prohibitin superfamily)